MQTEDLRRNEAVWQSIQGLVIVGFAKGVRCQVDASHLDQRIEIMKPKATSIISDEPPNGTMLQ